MSVIIVPEYFCNTSKFFVFFVCFFNYFSVLKNAEKSKQGGHDMTAKQQPQASARG